MFGKSKVQLSDDDKAQFLKAVGEELRNPPTIGIIGVSGTGKSSTINTMFRTSLPVSHTTACTKKFESSQIDVQLTHGQAEPTPTKLVVYDAPGLGEDIRQDPGYIEMYQRYLPKCDVILWVMAARNRALALDQTYLKEFRSLHSRMVFGLNQVDLVEPMNWKAGLPIPSSEQKAHITEIITDRSKRLGEIVDSEVKVIPYSNVRGFNLEELFAGLIGHVKGDRAWIFAGLRNFDFRQYLPK